MIDVDVETALIVAALTGFLTRILGVIIMQYVPLTKRVRRFLEAISSSVLIALIAPLIVYGDIGVKVAATVALITILISKNTFLALVCGLGAAFIVRNFI